MKKEKKQDTRLESQGAEFLVLGHLLVEGISAYKAYINFPGYDLTAVNPETRRVARLQVKSRWATNYDKSFPIKNFDCDFVIHVALNRGYAFGKRTSEEDDGIKPPEYFVFPVDAVKNAQKISETLGARFRFGRFQTTKSTAITGLLSGSSKMR